MAPIRILYEDPYLVLCVKPVGVLSEDSPAGACMPGLLREHYRALGQNDYIATVHRLDRLVGGVMLFSRRRDVTGKLTAAVAEHRVTKEYLAVLRGTPAQDEATLTDLLFRDAAHNKSYVVKRMRKGVRQASLSYTVQGEADGLTLVRVQLHTGRTHQIRVQLSHRIAATLLRYDVQQHGHAHVLCPPQRALQRRGVVPVDGSQIVKAQVVKDVIVKYGVLDVLFYGVYGVVYRLYPAYSVPVTAFELKICRAHTHAAQQSGHAADIAAYAHGVVVQDDHQRLTRLTRV